MIQRMHWHGWIFCIVWIVNGLTSHAYANLLTKKYINRAVNISSNKQFKRNISSLVLRNDSESTTRTLGTNGKINVTEANVDKHFKRQYIYGIPSTFPAFQPRRDLVSFPRVGIHRGACLHHICYHDGVCVRTLHGFYCDCPDQFIGAHCEYKRTCLENPCKNGATCTELGQGDFTCTCRIGSKGKTCDRKDACLPSPCNNGGHCTEVEDGYHCTCKMGFKGDRCQLKAFCYPNPCKNGATCIDRDTNDFQCSCALGFKGKLCEVSSECKNNPCVNGGTCIEKIVGYGCACLKGFAGKNCEVSLCSPNPCANDGVCTVSGDHHKCSCAHDYVGKYCEALDPCLNNPCLNGGECTVNYSKKGDVTGGFSCKCLKGYYGNMCQMR